ncbi:MAG: hypothetical protein JJD98_00235 [Polaromonas sp.]|nr:hypothetical protein [Polaromonas sp.]
MTYPTVNVNTTNLDASTDSPASARADLLDLVQKFSGLRPLPADLAASSGAAQVGGGDQVVASITALRALLKTSASKNAFVTGYYAAGDGGGGAYWYDSTDTTTADNGGTVIVATDGGRWKLVYGVGGVSIKQFGAKGDAATDDTAAITAAGNWLAALASQVALVFTKGTYIYSVSPNWAINHARILSDGEVRLRYTGTGNAVIIDAGSGAQNIYDVTFGSADSPFIIECPATASHACFVRAIHHSNIAIKPRGANTTSGAGLLVNFAVCTKFWITCSVNEDGGWYSAAKPVYGINLSSRAAAEQVSYCTFYTPIIEGTAYGMYLNAANGNLFVGGTAEGCTTGGVFESSACIGNTFIKLDFEVNTSYDVDSAGLQTVFTQCDSNLLITLRGNDQFINGGVHSNLTITVAALYAKLRDLRYNRLNNASVISNSGTLTTKAACVNYGSGALDAEIVPNITNYGAAISNPAPGASPWAYQNTVAYPVEFIAQGGTISNIQISRGGATYYSVTGATNGSAVRLAPGDYAKVTYSVAPNIYIVPM